MSRALVIAALVWSFAVDASAQESDAPIAEGDDDASVTRREVPDAPPALDEVATELRYYPPGQEPHLIVNDTEAPHRPDGADDLARDTGDYVPAGPFHHTLALRLDTMGAFDDERPVSRLGALYLVDIRPSASSVFRMRLGVGFTFAFSNPSVLTYYARLMPLGIDLARALVLRVGADIGLAQLVDIEARFLVAPVLELVLPIDDGHVEIGLQTSFPFLIGEQISELWTLGLLLGYVF